MIQFVTVLSLILCHVAFERVTYPSRKGHKELPGTLNVWDWNYFCLHVFLQTCCPSPMPDEGTMVVENGHLMKWFILANEND